MGRPPAAQEPLAYRRPPRGDRRRALGSLVLSFVDETPFSVGWIDEPAGWMARAAHAVALDDQVWVIDPFDAPGAEDRVRGLGAPAGVIQLFARHARDCAAWASRLGVPLHVLPRSLPASTGWEVVTVPVVPTQFEIALWAPAVKTLVCGDILAAGPGYKAPHEKVGVHPFFRLAPPRSLAELPVEHLLLGHGPGVHGPEARQAVRDALEGARRGTPRFLAGWATSLVRGRTPR